MYVKSFLGEASEYVSTNILKVKLFGYSGSILTHLETGAIKPGLFCLAGPMPLG